MNITCEDVLIIVASVLFGISFVTPFLIWADWYRDYCREQCRAKREAQWGDS